MAVNGQLFKINGEFTSFFRLLSGLPNRQSVLWMVRFLIDASACLPSVPTVGWDTPAENGNG
jgi:hypothetical protein